jgi:hypothetical protein
MLADWPPYVFVSVIHLGRYKMRTEDTLHEGNADAVACLPGLRAQVFSSIIIFTWWSPLLFLVRMFS